MCMHVFLGDREELLTIFQRGFHRKLQDQARHPVPDAFPVTFFLGGSFADRVGRLEQLAPTTFGRPHHLSATLDDLGRTSLGEAWTPSSNHRAIVAGRTSPAQLYARSFIARSVAAHAQGAARSCRGGTSSGTVICSIWIPCGVDSIQVACATIG